MSRHSVPSPHSCHFFDSIAFHSISVISCGSIRSIRVIHVVHVVRVNAVHVIHFVCFHSLSSSVRFQPFCSAFNSVTLSCIQFRSLYFVSFHVVSCHFFLRPFIHALIRPCHPPISACFADFPCSHADFMSSHPPFAASFVHLKRATPSMHCACRGLSYKPSILLMVLPGTAEHCWSRI